MPYRTNRFEIEELDEAPNLTITITEGSKVKDIIHTKIAIIAVADSDDSYLERFVLFGEVKKMPLLYERLKIWFDEKLKTELADV